MAKQLQINYSDMTSDNKSEAENVAVDKGSTNLKYRTIFTEAEERWLAADPEIVKTVGQALQAGAQIQRSDIREEFSFFIEPLLKKLTEAFPPNWLYACLYDVARQRCPQRAKKTERKEDKRTRKRREQREGQAKSFSERIIQNSDAELTKLTKAITESTEVTMTIPPNIHEKLKSKIAYRLAERIDQQWIFQRLARFHTQPRSTKSSEDVEQRDETDDG